LRVARAYRDPQDHLPAGSAAPYYFVTVLRRNLPSHHAFGALYSQCLIFRQTKATGEYRRGGKQSWVGEEHVVMSNREIGTSHTLSLRVADLKAKMRSARITEHEMKTFQKVAAVMGGGEGALRLHADDLIAASFVVETLDDPTSN
jgi:hypothetical protein